MDSNQKELQIILNEVDKVSNLIKNQNNDINNELIVFIKLLSNKNLYYIFIFIILDYIHSKNYNSTIKFAISLIK